MKNLKWLWTTYVRHHKGKLFFALFLVLITAILSSINPLIIGRVVDEILAGQDFTNAFWLLGGMVAVVTTAVTIGWCMRLLTERVSQNSIYALRKDVYVKLHDLDFDYFAQNKVGDIMAKMTGDMDAVRHFLSWVFFSLFENSMWLIFALVMLVQIDWLLTLVLLLTLPFIAFLAKSLVKDVKPMWGKVRDAFSSLNAVVSENIEGNRVVKAFAREDYEVEKFLVENENFMQQNITAASIWAKYIPPLDALSGLLNVIVILVGGYFVILDRITIGQLVTFNSFLWMLNVPMRMVGWLLNDLQRCLASLEKIKEVLDTEPKIKLTQGGAHKERIQGKIEFKNVSFHFEDDPSVAVLRNVSFTAEPGMTIGVLGETGAGKSTLVNLISRFYDAVEGQVLIDGIDIREWDARSLRSSISTVMQEVFLFSDTAAANIAFANTEADMSAVERVAALADAHHFIENLSDGYETIIGERGTGLSGGQKQRISLARALLKDPRILILDDTTSAVDMKTEYKIQKELNHFGRDRTTFIIAHRVSSVKDADLILVLDKGAIIESGDHGSLMEKKGYYASTYEEQLGTAGELL